MSNASEPIAMSTWRGMIARKFAAKREYLIPILQYVQSEEGYLSPQAVEAVSGHLRLPVSNIYGVASFYAQFHFEPRGKNTVTVCRGTACHVRGSARILKDVEKELDLAPGGTTEDMLFSLQTVACFGACARAPVVVVNERVHGQQTSPSARKLIARTREESAAEDESAAKDESPPSEETPMIQGGNGQSISDMSTASK